MLDLVSSELPTNGQGAIQAVHLRSLVAKLVEHVSWGVETAVTPQQYGAKGDGVNDDTAAILEAEATGHNLLFPRGDYLLSEQLTISAPGTCRRLVSGYGARLLTQGAIAALKVTGGGSIGGATIRGLHVDHRNNTEATAGFEVVHGRYVTLEDCAVEANGVNENYAAFLVRQADPTQTNTGSFWTKIINPSVRKRSGSNPGDIPYGIVLRGAVNATNIIGGQMASVTTGVQIETEPDQTYLANAVLVDGLAIEVFGTGIRMKGTVDSVLAGHRFVNNRFEAGEYAFSIEGITSADDRAPFMVGNFLSSSVENYLNNPNNQPVHSLDMPYAAAFWEMVSGL